MNRIWFLDWRSILSLSCLRWYCFCWSFMRSSCWTLRSVGLVVSKQRGLAKRRRQGAHCASIFCASFPLQCYSCIYIYRTTHLYSRLLSLNVFWLRIWILVVYSYQCIHMYIEIVWRSVVYGVYTVFGVGDQWRILEAWHVEGEWGKPGNREQKIKVLQTLLQRLWTFQCLRQESRERHWSSWREAPWFLSYIHTNVYIYTYRDSFVSEKKKSFADTSQLSLDIAMFAPGFQAASLELLARGSHGILYQYPRRGARERTCAGNDLQYLRQGGLRAQWKNLMKSQ